MKKHNPNNAKKILAYHWQKAMLFKKEVLLSLIITPIAILLERYVAPLLIAFLISMIQAGNVSLESSLWLIITYAILQILSQVIGYRINLYAMWGVQIKGAREIYQESFDKLSKHSVNFYADNFAGSLVSKVNKISSAFMSFWSTIIFQVIFIATSIMGTLVGVSILYWPYALVLFLLVVIFFFISFKGTNFMRPRQKARSEAYSNISANLSDSISNMLSVKIDSQERLEQERLMRAVDEMVRSEKYVRRGIISISSVNSFIITMMRIAALVISVIMVQKNIADAATVYLCLTFTFSLIQEIWNISETFRSYYQIIGDSEEMIDILEKPIEIRDSSKKELRVQKGSVAFKGVTFSHQEKSSALFKDLNFAIQPGQRVGIVGMSGSGKTTLTKLLLRFIDPISGNILIDGQDIAKHTQSSLHNAISYVPQEPLLFHRSLLENISYGKPGASKQAVIEAAKKAHAYDFIHELPEGIHTLVGERGIKLSGGQRQRVSIARALLKNAPILVLDEATSALDSESEQLIQQALDKLMAGRTSIVIAHRLSTIAKLDRIIVLDKGKIVEDGSHAELLKQKGIYAKLWARQSGGFIEE